MRVIHGHAVAALSSFAVLLCGGLLDALAAAARPLEIAADDDAKEKADKDKLKGTWRVVSLEADGVDQPTPPKIRITFDENGFAFGSDGQGGHKGTFTLGDSANPKTLDFAFAEGPHAGDRMLGIYAWDGDNLKLCVTGLNGADRPKDFATTMGSGFRLFVLTRETP